MLAPIEAKGGQAIGEENSAPRLGREAFLVVDVEAQISEGASRLLGRGEPVEHRAFLRRQARFRRAIGRNRGGEGKESLRAADGQDVVPSRFACLKAAPGIPTIPLGDRRTNKRNNLAARDGRVRVKRRRQEPPPMLHHCDLLAPSRRTLVDAKHPGAGRALFVV